MLRLVRYTNLVGHEYFINPETVTYSTARGEEEDAFTEVGFVDGSVVAFSESPEEVYWKLLSAWDTGDTGVEIYTKLMGIPAPI